MRAVVQRVAKASVTIEGRVTGSIEGGLLVLVGVAADDAEEDIAWLGGRLWGKNFLPTRAGG